MSGLIIKKYIRNSAAPCRKYVYSYPNLAPIINSLSITSSPANTYQQVYIYGENFTLNGTPGYSVVNFGSFQNLPVSFFGSTCITFVIPIQAIVGVYNVQVFNKSYPISLSSNIVSYTIS